MCVAFIHFSEELKLGCFCCELFYSKGKQVCMSVTGGIIQQQQQKFTAKISMHGILWYIYRAKFST